MDFGAIIKRSWQVTWRYRALWILGLFAGATGSSGGGSSFRSGGSSGSGSSSGDGLSNYDFSQWLRSMEHYLPIIIAAGFALFLIGIIWWIFSVGARGGLIAGVSAIEEGRPRQLGELWSAGFSRFWSLVGLDVMVQLPVLIVTLLMLGLIGIPLIAAAIAGRTPGAEVFVPICGSLLIGIPLLFIGGFILGVIRIIGERYIILGGQGAVDAAKNGWRFLRARVKDNVLMYLINWGLSIAASMALAIPAVIIGLVVAVPALVAIGTRQWTGIIGIVAVGVILAMVLGMAYSAIWGTFTSALWTIFFRQVTGMGAPALAVPPTSWGPSGPRPQSWDPLAQQPPSPDMPVPPQSEPPVPLEQSPFIPGWSEPQAPEAPPMEPVPPQAPPIAPMPPQAPPIAPGPQEPPTDG